MALEVCKDSKGSTTSDGADSKKSNTNIFGSDSLKSPNSSQICIPKKSDISFEYLEIFLKFVLNSEKVEFG